LLVQVAEQGLAVVLALGGGFIGPTGDGLARCLVGGPGWSWFRPAAVGTGVLPRLPGLLPAQTRPR